MGDIGKRHSVSDTYASFVLFPENDVGWFLVNAYAKAFKFSLDYLFVCQRFVDIQDDED